MRKFYKYHLKSLLILFLFFTLLTCIYADDTKGKIKWGFTALVFIEGNKIIAADRYGEVMMEGIAGKADADVIQTAIDSASPVGEIKK